MEDGAMAIAVQNVYDRMVRQFTTSTQDRRFLADFTDSINDVLDELMVAGGLTTAIPHVDTMQDTIDELDENHSFILAAGLVYYLSLAGYRRREGTDVATAKIDWDDKKGDFWALKMQEDQATVDDDDVPSEDIIGLGYKSE
jgi:hypothetical protein